MIGKATVSVVCKVVAPMDTEGLKAKQKYDYIFFQNIYICHKNDIKLYTCKYMYMQEEPAEVKVEGEPKGLGEGGGLLYQMQEQL